MLVVALVVTGIGGCATAARWEKSGASPAERQRDVAYCMARASREGVAPSAQPAGTASPGLPVDPQRARTQGYDAAVLDECMAARGYTRVSPRPSG
jgi:hypothetical protein